jgi:hypothetical protein
LGWTLSVGGSCADQFVEVANGSPEVRMVHHCRTTHDRFEIVARVSGMVDTIGLAPIGMLPISHKLNLGIRGGRFVQRMVQHVTIV